MFARLMRLWKANAVAFTTDGVSRVFISCRRCARVVPHYRCYGDPADKDVGSCKCGFREYSPVVLSEWRAAAWVLLCYAWRHKLRGRAHWDPRMPMRQL